MRWTDVPTEHIRRLHLLKTPFGAVCLHWLAGADPDPHLHDHPTSFLSIVLRGGYVEHRAKGAQNRIVARHWFNFIKASPEDRHRILDVLPGTLTLCFMGPKVRDWGFHIRGQFIPWRDYYRAKGTGCS